MRCEKCGHQNEKSAEYCANCGQKLTSVQNNNGIVEAWGRKTLHFPRILVAGLVSLIALASVVVIVGVLTRNDQSRYIDESFGTDEAVSGSMEVGDLSSDSASAKGGLRVTDSERKAEEGSAIVSDSIAVNGIEAKTGLAEYSWDELSTIARSIALQTKADALTMAKSYHLINANGEYPDSTKDVVLTNGKAMHMRLVGLLHDKTDTNQGMAGLTFLSDGIIANHGMSDSRTVFEGWGASSMRSWLSDEVWRSLPDEVARNIVPVLKLTNNSGESRTTESVSETLDRIWIPSVVELCGLVNWKFQSNPENSDVYNAILNAEGFQYEYFEQKPIDDFAENSVFSLGGEWWLRSASPATGKGRYVDGSGDPSYFGNANDERGVVLGFCL